MSTPVVRLQISHSVPWLGLSHFPCCCCAAVTIRPRSLRLQSTSTPGYTQGYMELTTVAGELDSIICFFSLRLLRRSRSSGGVDRSCVLRVLIHHLTPALLHLLPVQHLPSCLRCD